MGGILEFWGGGGGRAFWIFWGGGGLKCSWCQWEYRSFVESPIPVLMMLMLSNEKYN